MVHPSDIDYATNLELFDRLIPFDPNDTLWKDCNTSFEKYCLYPRINLEKYLPYDENIIVDSDVLCQYNPESLWKYVSNQPKSIVMVGRYTDNNWHWGYITEVSRHYGKHVPHVHGGFFYIRKSEFTNQFFEYSRVVFYKYDEYGCKKMFRGGKVDEIIFAITHSNFDMIPLEFDDIPVMTFNYNTSVRIPSKLQTEGNQNVELTDYIPFVHMFDKMEGSLYKSLYQRIMNNV